MDNIHTKSSVTAAIEKKLIQPHLMLQALVFTSILYFSVGQTPDTSSKTAQSVQTSVALSASITNSVLHHASQHSGLPTSALRIVQAQQKTWSDNCLELATSSMCTRMQIPGWQVAVASNQQHWIYRTNASGSIIKLERDTSLPNQENKEVALLK